MSDICNKCGALGGDCNCSGFGSFEKAFNSIKEIRDKTMPNCPFCGHIPDMGDPDTVYPSGIGWKVSRGFRHYVSFREVPPEQWCYSMHCVTTSGGCGAEISADSKEAAIAKWKRRS